jgi:phage tail sheath gpL-like
MAGITTALVRATQTITLDAAGEATDGETLVIGSKTYTFRATVGALDGSVHIGATVADTVANLIAAINLDATLGETGSGASTDYGTAMTRNPDVYATAVAATGVITLYAHVPGSIGNHVPVANGTATLTIGGAVLASGTGIIGDFFDEFMASVQLNSEAMAHLAPFSAVSGGKLD